MSDSFEQQTKKGKTTKSRSSNDSFIDRLLQDTFSDDDNFLPAQKPATTTSKNAQQYLEELDKGFSGKRKENAQASKKQTWVNDLEVDQFIVYFHCPVCLLPGHLSRSGTGVDIDHIRGCALSHGLHHRELISRLQSCPQKLERRKLVNKKIKKTIKKENKVEQQKKLSSQEVDEKMKVCKLMIIKHLGQDDDDKEEIAKRKVHCLEHLQKRVDSFVNFEKLVSVPTEEEKKEAKEKAIKNRKPGQSTPDHWIKAYLDRPEEDYYMPGFKEYFKFADD